MNNHEKLVDAAKKAIDAVMSDKSVDQSETRMSLKDIIEHAEICLDAL